MKRGTHYAKKLKRAYSKFRGCAARRSIPEPTPPVEQLILAVLSQETSLSRARKAAKQLNEDMIDYNELRVSTPAEISESIDRHVPRAVQCAKALIRLLNAIYRTEYAVSLDSLTSKGIREVKSSLERLEGITPYVTASVLLWSLGGHAVPINDPVLEFLKKQELVDPRASCAEVQSFLERHISAAEARSFCLDLEAYATSRAGAPAGDHKPRPSRSAARKKSVSKTKAAKKKKQQTKSVAPKESKSTRKKKKAARR